MRAPIVAAAIAAALAVAPAAAQSAPPPSQHVVLADTTTPVRWYAVDAHSVPGADFARSAISVPTSIAWTAPGETASAWIMLSVGGDGMRVGWRWVEGSAATLFVDTWTGGGYVADPVEAPLPPAQLPTPTPGTTVSVGVTLLTSATGPSDYMPIATTPADGAQWPLVAPLVPTTATTGATTVIRAAEVTAPPGVPAPTMAPVAFTDGLAVTSDGARSVPSPVTLTGGQRTTTGPDSPAALASPAVGGGAPLTPTSPWETTGTTIMRHAFASQWDWLASEPPLLWEQTTISVPSAMRWTAPSGAGQAASAWVMASASNSRWDQVGWYWQQGATAPQLFADVGQSPTYPTLNDPIQYGPTLTPGSSITVAVGCNPGTNTWTNWAWEAGTWVLLSAVDAGQPCDGQGLTWYRSLEDVSAVGQPQPTPAQPVHFTAASAESAAGNPVPLPPFTAVKGTYSINE